MGEIVFQLPMKSEEVCLKGLLFLERGSEGRALITPAESREILNWLKHFS